MISPGVVAAISLVGVRGDPCGALRWSNACVGIYQLLI